MNGKPRQKVIKHLGSVPENKLDKLWLRVSFWDKVRPQLDALRLMPDERAKIEQQLAARIQPVPEAEAEAHRQESEKFWKATIEIGRAIGVLKPRRSAQRV